MDAHLVILAAQLALCLIHAFHALIRILNLMLNFNVNAMKDSMVQTHLKIQMIVFLAIQVALNAIQQVIVLNALIKMQK